MPSYHFPRNAAPDHDSAPSSSFGDDDYEIKVTERTPTTVRNSQGRAMASFQTASSVFRLGTLKEYLLVKPLQMPKRVIVFLTTAIAVLLWWLYMINAVPHVGHSPARPLTSTKLGLTHNASGRPEDYKLYGLVFYGRHVTVEILDCYLRKNLVSNGGRLDAVHFVVNTDDEADLAWIDQLVSQVEDYKAIRLEEGTDPRDYERVWAQAVESGHLYIKFDDDLVWLSDNAIEESVNTIINHPEAFIVLGNLINSAALGWVHHHRGAIHSYLPELQPPENPSLNAYGPTAWRASALPTYEPAHGYDNVSPYPEKEEDEVIGAGLGDFMGPPYANHRWLPLRDKGTLLPLTPMWRTEYEPNSADWRGWQLGAQQHYSFLQNLESGDLSAYHFGDKEGIWNMHFLHANINLMTVWADDILDNLPFDVKEDDEAHFSIHLPRKLKRQTYIQTRALASHFSFGPQRQMYETDLLSRYRAYANEKVCGTGNQIAIPKDLNPGRIGKAR